MLVQAEVAANADLSGPKVTSKPPVPHLRYPQFREQPRIGRHWQLSWCFQAAPPRGARKAATVPGPPARYAVGAEPIPIHHSGEQRIDGHTQFGWHYHAKGQRFVRSMANEEDLHTITEPMDQGGQTEGLLAFMKYPARGITNSEEPKTPMVSMTSATNSSTEMCVPSIRQKQKHPGQGYFWACAASPYCRH